MVGYRTLDREKKKRETLNTLPGVLTTTSGSGEGGREIWRDARGVYTGRGPKKRYSISRRKIGATDACHEGELKLTNRLDRFSSRCEIIVMETRYEGLLYAVRGDM